MDNNIEFIEGGCTAAKGFSASGVYTGLGGNQEKGDMALIYSENPGNVAAVFTKNKVKASHIFVTRDHIKDGKAQAIICNSGNANTCAPNGMEVAEEACDLVAGALGIKPEDVLPASTGVIGVELKADHFEQGVPKLAAGLDPEGSHKAARAIMTTDTVPKEFAVKFTLEDKECVLGGIAKGSGMIHINMGTMLCFMTTDAAISSQMLQKALSEVIVDSFNQVSVDGDTSTNDTVDIIANGMAGNPEITEENEDYYVFKEALERISVEFAKHIAADGEGATKLLQSHVLGAATKDIARKTAKTIIGSNLVKTAIFGEDANWGRVLCAVGYTDADFDVANVDITLCSDKGELPVCRHSAAVPFSEEKASTIMAEEEVTVLVDLHDGSEESWAWGCDLSYEYVKINGEYRS
ncbi:MAG: bifunctional glutamate N-acetyltransferase/amino-acid acetyltransferase ArgJ [Eubacteriales bacterium]|nr:bifunctional glutamate N-acetyltransferase/amino-acid acetyltransferase ArgJ [Eubacteriales bacterium]